MARKKSFEAAKRIPGVRKTLFFIYGDLVFRRYFDLALRYFDAIKVARGGKPFPYDLLGHAGQEVEKEASFAALHQHIEELVVARGPEVIIELGSLLSGIIDCESRPNSKDRMLIMRAHLVSTARLGRPPALEELRKEYWLISARPEAERKVGAKGIHAVDDLLRIMWDNQSHRMGAIKDPKQLKRIVGDMGLAVSDGKLLRRYRQRFENLTHKLARKPTIDEYASGAQSLAFKTRGPLRNAEFHQFIDYLADPLGQDPVFRWGNLGQVREIVRDCLSLMKASTSQVSATILLLESIAKLDVALDVLRVSLLEGQMRHLPRSKSLTEVFTYLAGVLNQLPRADDVLMHCEPAKLSEIGSELNLSDEIKTVWIRLKCLLCPEKPSKPAPLAPLIDGMPEMQMLTEVFQRTWLEFWPRLLWAEFVQS